MKEKNFTIFIIIIVTETIFSQDDSISIIQKLPSGISIQYGLGKLGVKDFYISEEKYSGYTNNFYFSWNKLHNNHHNRLELDYRYGNSIKNNNVQATIHQFSLNRINLYPVGDINLFSKNASLYLGPSTDIFFHYRQQNIGRGGSAMTYAISFVALFSGGFNTDLIYPISNNIDILLNNTISIFSLGFKMSDFLENDVAPVKFLTPLKGLNFITFISVNYQIYQRLSINLGYQSFLTRITAWDKFTAASDNLLITISYNFK